MSRKAAKTVIKIIPKKCYICGRNIRFVPANNDNGYAMCDFERSYVFRNEDGALYVDARGNYFHGSKDVLYANTITPGFKVHKCNL